jgi:hypothetical protein
MRVSPFSHILHPPPCFVALLLHHFSLFTANHHTMTRIIIKRFFLFYFLFIGVSSSAARAASASKKNTEIAPRRASSGYDRFIQRMYNDADVDHDGFISFAETYEMVLKLYININRQAPINPPSREKVRRLFVLSDTSRNNRINREEFTQLARVLVQRALVRIITCKVTSLVGAPLLATYLVGVLGQQEWLPQLAEKVVPGRFLPTVTNPEFGRTILMVIFLATLGKFVMNVVNLLLDLTLVPRNEDTIAK